MEELKSKYQVFPVYLSKMNEFILLEENVNINCFPDVKGKKLIFSKGKINKIPLDVAVLCFHGKYGEDGRVSGLLDLYDIAHTGSNSASLAICQDKIFSKQLLKYNGIDVIEEVEDFPCVLKAANLGSSIGIKVVKDKEDFLDSLYEVKKYDYRVLREKYLDNYREFNLGVITDGINYSFSNIEEVYKKDAILSYNDKYYWKSNRKIPAVIPFEEEMKSIGKKVCDILNVRGVVRIDFLYSDKIYVNEINSIPGSMSYYLWDFSYLELLERIIKIALLEKQKEEKLIQHFSSDILSLKSKK